MPLTFYLARVIASHRPPLRVSQSLPSRAAVERAGLALQELHPTNKYIIVEESPPIKEPPIMDHTKPRTSHQDTSILLSNSIDHCARDLNDLLPKIRALSSFLPSASDCEADILKAMDSLSSASSTLHRLGNHP